MTAPFEVDFNTLPIAHRYKAPGRARGAAPDSARHHRR